MFKNRTAKKTVPATQTIALAGVLWFIHDNPGITEKVPYMNEQSMLTAIQKFYTKYGADHESEFMVIFTDPANKTLNDRINAIVGADYGICDMFSQPRLF